MTHSRRGHEVTLTVAILRFAGLYGCYGYRRVHALLRSEGWEISYGREARVCQREELKSPQKLLKHGEYGTMNWSAFARGQSAIIMRSGV